MTALTTYLVGSLLGLVALAALGAAAVWWGRRAGLSEPAGPLRLVGRLRLDARRALYVVRVGEVVYVIGASEGGLEKLGELPASSLPDARITPGSPLVVPFLRRVLPEADAPAGGGESEAS